MASGLAIGGGTALSAVGTALLLQAVSSFDLWHIDKGIRFIGVGAIAGAIAPAVCQTWPLYLSLREARWLVAPETNIADRAGTGSLRSAVLPAIKSALIVTAILLFAFVIGEAGIGVVILLGLGLGRLVVTSWFLLVVSSRERRHDCRYELTTAGSWGWLEMPLVARPRTRSRPTPVSESQRDGREAGERAREAALRR